MKIPNEKYQILKCLFKKFFALYDLRIILNDKNNKNLLMNYQKFPLYFFDKGNFNIFNKPLLSEIKINIILS